MGLLQAIYIEYCTYIERSKIDISCKNIHVSKSLDSRRKCAYFFFFCNSAFMFMFPTMSNKIKRSRYLKKDDNFLRKVKKIKKKDKMYVTLKYEVHVQIFLTLPLPRVTHMWRTSCIPQSQRHTYVTHWLHSITSVSHICDAL